MRPIKFRAVYQSPNTDEPNKLCYGSEAITIEELAGRENVQIDFTDGSYLMLDEMEPEFTKWLQFTGLHDRNGKEIYEGDVVRGEIEYGDDNGQPTGDKETVTEVVKWGVRMTGCWPGFFARSINDGEFPIEVIGNIYENPELVK